MSDNPLEEWNLETHGSEVLQGMKMKKSENSRLKHAETFIWLAIPTLSEKFQMKNSIYLSKFTLIEKYTKKFKIEFQYLRFLYSSSLEMFCSWKYFYDKFWQVFVVALLQSLWTNIVVRVSLHN